VKDEISTIPKKFISNACNSVAKKKEICAQRKGRHVR
jgi:hypothetical protein